ncbi:MAG: leucine-rich repeat domain-containing protein [Prevotella sp.]|nr:leucine-rich repeat domain-containing protein [Prevotella sp.]
MSYKYVGCSDLTAIQVEIGNTVYDSRENCNAIIETASNTILRGCQNTVIPNSISSIGEEAFYHCTCLTSISIPNSVTSIGKYRFSLCWNLATVIIPNSIINIGDYAFVRSGLKDMYCCSLFLPVAVLF